jgi:hypothetical protein
MNYSITSELCGWRKTVMFSDEEIDSSVVGRAKMIEAIFDQNNEELHDFVEKELERDRLREPI